jgi:hypothetical protein
MRRFNNYICERNWDKFQSNYYIDDQIKSAIYDYVIGYTTGVNDDMRRNLKRGSKNVKKYLDMAFESDYATVGRVNVFRVVTWDYMKNIYGITPNNIDSFIGDIITNRGYMSTSRKRTSVWGTLCSDELMLHIVSKKPYPYIDVNKVLPEDDIDCASQEELLLPRNTSMEILSYKVKRDGTFIIELEIV